MMGFFLQFLGYLESHELGSNHLWESQGGRRRRRRRSAFHCSAAVTRVHAFGVSGVVDYIKGKELDYYSPSMFA